MTKPIHSMIDGAVFHTASGRVSAVHNPATGQQTASLGLCSADELRQAVASAKAAFPEWSEVPPAKKARMMMAYRELLVKNQDKLAKLLGEEHGKVYEDALGEVQRGIENVEFACGIPHLLKGEYSRNVGPAVDSYTLRMPMGVCAGITPFNFPAMVPLWMFPLAIVCGNSFILKPSECDPSTPLLLYELFIEAGFPPNVLQLVNGDKEVVDAILTDPDIKAVSFVGSTPIAAYVYQTGTANHKRVQALGGAKNHMVILPDADLDQAADALIGAGYGSAGERCMAISVAVPVGQETADRLIDKLAPRVSSLKIGPATDKVAEMGPLVTKQHYDRVVDYIDQGVKEGAELVVDGRDFKMQGYEDGFFMGGSLFDRVTPDMSIYREEIFGPVLSTVRVDSFDDAVSLIHNHHYANGVAIFTRDGDAARNFANHIEVGMVGINVPIPVPVAYHSFGGWKQSFFGSNPIYGPEGINFYTRLKTVSSRWPTGIRAGAQLNFPGSA